ARRDAERAATLEAAGAISQQALEEARQEETSAEAALTDAQARVSSAGKQLADATVRAPFRGIVSESSISLGDVVQPGTELFTVVDPSSMELEAAVPARDLALLERGTSVAFDVTGYPERGFTGRIDRISPSADPATGQVLIYVTIPNAEGALVGGLFANGRVATEEAVGLAVPASAIDKRGLAPAVYRIRGGRVEKLTVSLGLRDDVAEQVQLLSGVTAGDTLLLGSAQGLTEGTAVEISGGSALPADTSRTAQ
ncbi:MAG: efflux RND transporter periplasmic adaptor subunit, partial [Gemmatimonadales bacterium]